LVLWIVWFPWYKRLNILGRVNLET
jgi:hypothetical protein